MALMQPQTTPAGHLEKAFYPMKKIRPFLLLIIFLLASCKEEDAPELGNTCNVANPTEDLPWLKAEIDQRTQSQSDIDKYFYISQATYQNETVFIYNNCCPMCNTVVPVYNCQGQLLFYLSQEPAQAQKIKNWRLIWKPANFSCQEG